MAAREIQIETIYGKKAVAVEATYGAFAVHEAGFNGGYVVTHMPTGLAATFSAPSVKRGLCLARMLMRAGVRWTFSDVKKMPKKTQAVGRAVVERWRAKQE